MRSNMLKRWSDYKVRIGNLRQKYFTVMRRGIALEKQKVKANFKRKIIKGTLITCGVAATYMIGNQLYSEHIQIKKMKQKLMKNYPDRTFIISFEEDPIEIVREIQSYNQSQDANKTDYNHCVFINDESKESKQLKEKLGNDIVIFSPKNIDEFCHAIDRCYKYRHSALIGDYPINQDYGQNFSELKKSLSKIEEPKKKNKYLVIDLSLFKKAEIDESNDTISAQVGMKCGQLNKILESKGYEPLFQDFQSNLTIHEIITNNLPLNNNDSLLNRLENLNLISPEGKKFKSSRQVCGFGTIPNLTSFFVGTGGIFAIPALATVRLKRKSEPEKTFTYEIESNNLSELVLEWRQIRQYLSSKQIAFSLSKPKANKLILTTSIPLKRLAQVEQNKVHKRYPFILSIDNKCIEQIILNNYPFDFSYSKGLLYFSPRTAQGNQSDLQLSKFMADMGRSGAVLVWAEDKQLYKHFKERNDLTEAGAELMKKIVEIREGIDKRQVLEAHDRYEKYFAKGFFRKITEFFW